jgi:energy-converting hydrogenase Eha subunit G
MRHWGAVFLLAGVLFFVTFQAGVLFTFLLSPEIGLFIKVGGSLALLGAILLLVSIVREGLSKKA